MTAKAATREMESDSLITVCWKCWGIHADPGRGELISAWNQTKCSRRLECTVRAICKREVRQCRYVQIRGEEQYLHIVTPT